MKIVQRVVSLTLAVLGLGILGLAPSAQATVYDPNKVGDPREGYVDRFSVPPTKDGAMTLYKNRKLSTVTGIKGDLWLFHSNQKIPWLFACEGPLDTTANREGVYHWNYNVEEGTAICEFQGKWNGNYLMIASLKLTQVGGDIQAEIIDTSYPYNQAYGYAGTGVPCQYGSSYYMGLDPNATTGMVRISLHNVELEFADADLDLTVTFKDADGNVLKTETVKFGEAATPPEAPVREGYVFYKWDVDVTSITDDVEIHPIYHRFCTVTFQNPDGTVLKTQTVEETMAAEAPDMTGAVVDGQPFRAWDVDFSSVTEDLTVTAIYAGEVTYEGFIPLEQTLLFPGYQMDGVVGLAGVARGSYSTNTPQEFQLDQMYSAPSTGVLADGVYLFEKTVNEAGEIVVTAEFQFIARYMLGIRVELVQKENGIYGRVVDYKYMYNRTDKKEYGTTLVGNQDFGSAYYAYAYDKSESGNCKMALHDLTLIGARRVVKMNTVTFQDLDGKVLLVDGQETQTVASGEPVKTPDFSVAAGYRFEGWDHDCSAVYGDWIIRPIVHRVHTVTFVDPNGQVLKKQVVIDGEAAEAPDLVGSKIGRRAFWGWDSSFDAVSSDLTVTAQYGILVDSVIDEALLATLNTEEIYLPNAKLKKVVGAKASIRMKYGSYNKALDLSSFALCEVQHFAGSGFYDFRRNDEEISFEIRGYASNWGYDGIADACKIVLRQKDDDIVGTVVWAQGGCYATQFMGLPSWDGRPSFGYSSGFGYNDWNKNYTITIDSLTLVVDEYVPGMVINVR